MRKFIIVMLILTVNFPVVADNLESIFISTQGEVTKIASVSAGKAINLMELTLKSCWFNTVTNTELAVMDDLQSFWEQILKGNYIYYKYPYPISIEGSGIKIQAEEILFGTERNLPILTRFNDKVVQHYSCGNKEYMNLACSDIFLDKFHDYSKDTCSLMKMVNVPKRIEGQLIHHVFVQWTPDNKSLSIQDQTGALSEEDLASLENCGLKGTMRIRVAGRNYYGRPRTKVIIISQAPINKEINLRVPNESAGIYYQKTDGTYSACDTNMPTVDQIIVLKPGKRDPNVTHYSILSPDGSSQGGTAAIFNK